MSSCCLCVCRSVCVSPLIPDAPNSGALCVCVCNPPIIARQRHGEIIVVHVVFYAVRAYQMKVGD
jgi:hypothetical protein